MGHSETGESDWRTVTSEYTRDQKSAAKRHHTTQLGSSLADVSDATDYTSGGYDYAPSDQLFKESLHPRSKKSGYVPNPRSQLQTAIRRISSSLDGITHGWRLASQVYEMQDVRGSFDSLASSNSSDDFHNGTHWEGFSPGRDSQEMAVQRYKHRQSDTNSMASPNIPRLPFPLISLPEAAKLQHVRRERGEEDHTEPANSFVTRGFSETISTISAPTSPLTPRSILHPSNRLEKGEHPNKPRPIYSHHTTSRDHTMSPDICSSRIPSIAVFGKKESRICQTPDPRWPCWSSTDDEFRELAPKLLRLRGFSASTRDRRAKDGLVTFDQSLFSASETQLMQTARDDILYRRRFVQDSEQLLATVFVSVLLLSLIFPIVGLLALCGVFNPTISWYTHGEVHTFMPSQRTVLKRLLLVEGILFVVLVIILSVYFSVGL